jgi:hypothetical protein
MKNVVKQFCILSAVMLIVMASLACGKDSEGEGAGWDEVGTIGTGDHEQIVDQSLLTPEADGTFSMAPTTPPVPTATLIPEATSTPDPTSTPEPTFTEIYRDDVVAALHGYYVAYHSRSQSALDRVTTAATTYGEYGTVEFMKSASAMGRGWSDYPDIDIVEVTHLKCDEVLCKIWYDAISNPPSDSRDAPFDIQDHRYFRLVDGNWLEDHTHDTWTDEWDSTHRK